LTLPYPSKVDAIVVEPVLCGTQYHTIPGTPTYTYSCPRTILLETQERVQGAAAGLSIEYVCEGFLLLEEEEKKKKKKKNKKKNDYELFKHTSSAKGRGFRYFHRQHSRLS
jgi:hypothetical protein